MSIQETIDLLKIILGCVSEKVLTIEEGKFYVTQLLAGWVGKTKGE